MLDIDHIDTKDWAQRDYPIPERRGENKVDVVIARSVLNEIYAHGKSRMDVEVCGVLVGDAYQDSRGPFIYVDASIRGLHSDNQVAQVTFTAETWAHIQKQLDDKYSDRRIIGWYHTHPGFGIFLSGMDMFIHENFFNTAEQLAVVYDPHSGEAGVFVWHDGNADREKIVVHENAPAEHLGDVPVLPPPAPRLSAAAGDEILWRRVRTLERRQQLLTIALIAVALIAFAFPLVLSSIMQGNRGGHHPTKWIKGSPTSAPDKKSNKTRSDREDHGRLRGPHSKSPSVSPDSTKKSGKVPLDGGRIKEAVEQKAKPPDKPSQEKDKNEGDSESPVNKPRKKDGVSTGEPVKNATPVSPTPEPPAKTSPSK